MRSPLRKKILPINLRSLRFILIVPFALQTLIIVGIVATLSHQSSEENIEKLVTKITIETSQSVTEHLQAELESIEKINQINQSIVNGNLSNDLNLELLEKTFLAELNNFPSIYAIGIAHPPNKVLRFKRLPTPTNQFELQRIEPSQANVLQRFQVNSQGEQVTTLESISPFSLDQWSWYTNKPLESETIWSRPYVSRDHGNILITAYQPIHQGSIPFFP